MRWMLLLLIAVGCGGSISPSTDASSNGLGSPCDGSVYATCESDSQILVCVPGADGGEWTRVACRGPRGCIPDGNRYPPDSGRYWPWASCDDRVAAEGETCITGLNSGQSSRCVTPADGGVSGALRCSVSDGGVGVWEPNPDYKFGCF